MTIINQVSPFSGNSIAKDLTRAVCGESVYLSYRIECDEASSMKIEVLPPESGSSQIPADAVHSWIVVPKSLSGGGLYQGVPQLREEFLLKDFPFVPEDSYKDGRKEAIKSMLRNPASLMSKRALKLLRQSFPLYVPPQVRLDGPLLIHEPMSSPVRILIRIDMPRHLASDVYCGRIRVSDSHTVRGEVEYKIHGIKAMLDESSKDSLMFYRGTLDPLSPHAPQHYVDEKRFKHDLTCIYDAGFRSISLQESRAGHLARALAICKELGFHDKILFRRPFPPLELVSRYDFFTPVLYASDEISTLPDLWPFHHEAVRLAKEVGALSFSTVLSPDTLIRFSNENCMPDLVSVYVGDEKPRSLISDNKQRHSYYWLTHLEKPLVNSFLSGCYLYKSDASGFTPYAYQHMPVTGSSPYQEYDDWEPTLDKPQAGRISRHVMSVYPALDGIVSTLQWEALRSGLIEYRLIETVFRLEESCIEKGLVIPEKINFLLKSIKEYLRNIDMMKIDILSPYHTLPHEHFDTIEYESWQVSLQQCFSTLSELYHNEFADGC